VGPIHKPVKENGQVFHLGDQRSWISFGSWFINAECENIPLVATWCDYFYSEEGIFFSNYGVEGVSFEYDENGKPMLTDFIIENPGGLSWAIMSYAMCEIIDGGVSIRNRSYAYPGGERIMNFHTYWIDPSITVTTFDGVAHAVTFTNEENEQLVKYTNDIATYISENYVLFVDGSKPLSEFDSYVSGVKQMNLQECIDIYQAAYDRFAEKFIN
jgi:putative aldouronate transport system substrate-binding protein